MEKKSDAQTRKIRLYEDFCNLCTNISSLINQVYPNLTQHIADHDWLQKRAILTPTNAKVDEINFSIQEMMPIEPRSYYLINKIMDGEESTAIQLSF